MNCPCAKNGRGSEGCIERWKSPEKAHAAGIAAAAAAGHVGRVTCTPNTCRSPVLHVGTFIRSSSVMSLLFSALSGIGISSGALIRSRKSADGQSTSMSPCLVPELTERISSN